MYVVDAVKDNVTFFLWCLVSAAEAEAEESQESSMTDADDGQLHTAESDEVF